MTPEEAPVGSVVFIGHEDNGITAYKDEYEEWRYTNGFGQVPYDDMRKMATLVYAPGVTHI